MKRVGNIFDDMIDIENCKSAIFKASTGKRKRKEVRAVLDNLDHYAAELSAMLSRQTYAPTPYRIIVINDGPQKKERTIQVPAFYPDQCVHHALMNVLAPILDRRMYYWSCGSRKNKGIAHAKKGVERATLKYPKRTKYAVKLDIQKCYASIRNDLMYSAFEGLIKDRRALWLIKTIIDSSDGLPIGNYTSAWFCNFFLTPVDRLAKDVHNIRHYIRYIDDMVLIDSNKRKLYKAVQDIETMLNDKMGLTLHDNWNIFRIRRSGDGKRNRPIDFVGYRFCIGYTLLRRRNALTLMRQSRKIQRLKEAGRVIPYRTAAGFLSRVGQVQHCKAHGLKIKYIDPVSMRGLKGVVRNESNRERITAGGLQHRKAAG